MRDVLDVTVLDAESVTVRSVAGRGDQAELPIQTRRGTLTLRLLGRHGHTIRLTDLRARDTRRRRGPMVAVPFDAVDGNGTSGLHAAAEPALTLLSDAGRWYIRW